MDDGGDVVFFVRRGWFGGEFNGYVLRSVVMR